VKGLARLVADALQVAEHVHSVNLAVNVELSRQLQAAASVLTAMRHNATAPAAVRSGGGEKVSARPHYSRTLRVEGSRKTVLDAVVQALLAAVKVSPHVVLISLMPQSSNHGIAVLAPLTAALPRPLCFACTPSSAMQPFQQQRLRT
jgi:hypothetical protein